VFITATVIFVISYALIVYENIHKTKAALLGAVLTLGAKVLTQNEALHDVDLGVDWNVILLLISMMIIVNVMAKSGAFQYLAVKTAKLGRGEPFPIMMLFALAAAVASAFLDNVTTVLLLAPVTLLIAQELELDPVPFLITLALASNIGGTATLIGDPPNIMIASKAGLTFMDFINHLAPAVILAMAAWLAVWKVAFGGRLRARSDLMARIMAMDESKLIRDKALLGKSAAVLALTVLGFLLHSVLGYEPATVALAGAACLLLISGEDPQAALAEVEWPTIFFFIGLYIIIGGTVKAGLIAALSREMIELTGPARGHTLTLSMTMVWFSAAASALVDNVPFVAAMNPLLTGLAGKIFAAGAAPGLPGARSPEMLPVWCSLALGACLGGNATAIGASANVLVLGLAQKAGYKVSFWRYLKYGLPVMLLTVSVASFYIYVRYYLLKW
jgi:Na+/H+ antiporter NhaD/arsenite permease-like protein